MSAIIPTRAFGKKRETIHRTKLATQDKTKKCSHCPAPAVIEIKLKSGEIRRLCDRHLRQNQMKNVKAIIVDEGPFVKASELLT